MTQDCAGLHRNTLRARELRDMLMAQMGGCCSKCGSVEELEFDHIHGRSYELSKLFYLQRMNRYVAEWSRKELRILCAQCNKAERKTDDEGKFITTHEFYNQNNRFRWQTQH